MARLTSMRNTRGDLSVPRGTPVRGALYDAAPSILRAQNPQDERDRPTIERDRQVAARTQDDTEYLARELASVRLALADVVTNQDLDESLTRIAKLIADRA